MNINWQYIAATTYKPGQTVRSSAIYTVLDKQAQDTGYEITCNEGDTFPPPPPGSGGYMYALRSRAHHKHDEGADDAP